MHYCWCIWKGWNGMTADKVPAYKPMSPADQDVDIQWLHRSPQGQPDLAASKAAAGKMFHLYGMEMLLTPPAYDPSGIADSRHVAGKAIDMTISWRGNLKIPNRKKQEIVISSLPRDATNADLIKIGADYGVIHFKNVLKDRPHWSTDGH